MLKRVALAGAALTAVAVVIISIAVQRESVYVFEELGGSGPARALVLYHPSRDARFSDDLSLAVAHGFEDAGLAVVRATMTRDTPQRPEGYAIVAVVSNTYFWTPDAPTRRYLHSARLDGIPAIGLVGGAGSTARSERLLGEALRRSGASTVETRSFWLLRPNDQGRMDEPNRAVALDLARSFAAGAAAALPQSHFFRQK